MPRRRSDDDPAATSDLLESLAMRTVFTPIRESSTVAEAVARIGRACELGLVRRGERLPSEEQLAGALKISTGTLRSALAMLRETGLIETRRGRGGGNFIASSFAGTMARGRDLPTLAELEDLADLRSLVEGGSAALAAERMPAGQLARLEAVVAESAAETAARQGLERWQELDSLFHILIADASGSPSIVALVTDLRARTLAITGLLITRPTASIRLSDQEHARILRAIRRRSPEAARRAAVEHVRSTLALWIGLMAEVRA